MEPRQRFAENLRRRRRERGLSQEALGELCDLHRTEVSLLERGGRDPRLATIVKIAWALELAPGDLLAGLEAPGGQTCGPA